MRKSYRTAILVVAALAVITSAALALQVGSPAPAFKLSDQFGKTWELASLRNNVVVVVAATQDSGRAMGPWVDTLKTKYGSKIQLLGLMDLHGIPGFARGIARSRIRKETSDPLMIDFNGATARSYSVSDKYPIVVVIDKTGVTRAVAASEFSQNAMAPVTAAIDKAL